MAEKGLWSIGNFNLPDFGISEALNIGPKNASIVSPEMSKWQQYSGPIGSNVQLSPNASPILKANQIQTQPSGGSDGTPPKTYSNTPTPEPTQTGGGLTADVLRSKFGFSDENVIRGILNDPGQRQRYENEMGSSAPSGQDPFAELYQSSISALTDAEKMFQGQAEEARKGVTEQAGLARSAYEEALAKSKEAYTTQREDLTNEERMLQAESIRAYNNLKQSYMNRFGGGSSTGAALADLVGQQFIRSSGQLREKYLSGVKVLQAAERDAFTNFNQAVQTLEQSIVQSNREINANLATELQNISMQKAGLEDNKRAMREEAMRTAMANAQQLQATREQKIFDLGLWKLQRDEEIGKGSAFLDDLASEVASSMKSQKYAMQSAVLQPNRFFTENGSYSMNRTSPKGTDPYEDAGLLGNR